MAGWELVEFSQNLINKNMEYSYTNSFDMPRKAFENGRGYCWQQAKSLNILLKALSFNCWMVYATKNIIPEKNYGGIAVREHISGHVWCRVNINGVVKDVCPGNPNNRPGITHFSPITQVKRWNFFISFWSYWGSVFINFKRYREIQAQKRTIQL